MAQAHKIPKAIRDVGFDFSWSEQKVWRLNQPVEDMPIEELTWHFDVPFLWEGDDVYNLKPREVLMRPLSHAKEYERTLNADLKHPIDIMWNKGQWLILDGLHRLMKAHLKGDSTVKVRKIPRERVPEIVKDA